MSKVLVPVRTPWANTNPILTQYYDEEWGMPVFGETEVFERLSLETFQSGLSWLSILKRRDAFRKAFANFDVDLVAQFTESDVERLLNNTEIIRNQKKIRAVINNAKAVVLLRNSAEYLGIADLVWSFMPEISPCVVDEKQLPSKSEESIALSKELKRNGFSFVGPTMAYAAMAAIGVVDVHVRDSFRRGCSGLWNIDGTKTDNSNLIRRRIMNDQK